MAYIYEHIRTRGYEPMHFEEHFIYLEAAVRLHFNRALNFTREELRTAIKEALQRERFSPNVMNAVEVQYSANGELNVEAKEILYNAFSLRALHPQVYIHNVSGRVLLDNTSAKKALVEFNRSSNEGAAIWVSEQGEVLAIDGMPVIAVFEDEIRFSQRGKGVEFDLAFEAASATKRKTTKGRIGIEELDLAKELLFIGYEGLSAIQHYGLTPYMDIMAEKLAAKIAEAEL